MPLGGTLDYSFVAGDTGSTLKVTCRRADTDEAIDLTLATVTLKWRIDDGGTLQTAAMTPDPDQVTNKGVATYTFGTGELTAGQMVAEVEVLLASLTTSSLEPFHFTVRAKI